MSSYKGRLGTSTTLFPPSAEPVTTLHRSAANHVVIRRHSHKQSEFIRVHQRSSEFIRGHQRRASEAISHQMQCTHLNVIGEPWTDEAGNHV